MNSMLKQSPDSAEVSYGAPMAGGFYAGRILVANIAYALIVAPKASGEHRDTVWNESYANVPGALSYNDGLANTRAMAEAGSALAAWALALNIDGIGDWYLGSQDELEILYRNLKPGTETNSQWGRSGINVSAIPLTYPYLVDSPAQTVNELFRTDGTEAFDEVAYWTSTQHASYSDYAWLQYFGNGYQYYWLKDGKLRARAVRRLPL
jgi:uncharacterized protein DUF1566